MSDLYHATRVDMIGLALEQAETTAAPNRRLAVHAAELEQLRRLIAELTVRRSTLE